MAGAMLRSCMHCKESGVKIYTKQYNQENEIGKNIIRKETTGSTNADALAAAEVLPHGTVITAEEQTAGRGRRGRTWESPRGANLYFSLLLKPDFEPEKAPMLTLLMALAVVHGISNMSRGISHMSRAQIKWPNDIVIHGKKVCGILTEMQLEQGNIKGVVIGVGVNMFRQDFLKQDLPHASSLEAELGWNQPESVHGGMRETLLQSILQLFSAYYRQFCKVGSLAPVQKEYEANLANLQSEVRVLDPQGEFTGTALGIDEQGQLIVRKEDDTTVHVYAGEVSVRGIYGYI